jgi:hypothetical protein
VHAAELRDVPRIVDGGDLGGLGQERAHHRLPALDVPAEIVEGVGVAALDDGVSLVRKRAHATFSCAARIRKMPASGTRSQSGR